MNIEDLNQFRKILIDNKKAVSEIEYTKNNYDNDGNLIKGDLPTITTDFCETGLYNEEIYLVFIIESKTFNSKLFNAIKNKSNVKMYGFIDFNKTLYPITNFSYDNFIRSVLQDAYLQIQFDFKKINPPGLFNEYLNLVDIFDKYKIVVVNQLKRKKLSDFTV